MTPEELSKLWTEAMAALNAKDFARAEEIAAQMHVKSDAGLVRERIAEAKAGLDKHPD